MFSKLKISTKLIISSTVFLIPIAVLLLFIIPFSRTVIQRSREEQIGIQTLKPSVEVMQMLPQYFNVYLGLGQGNLRELEEQISNAIRTIDRGLRRYRTEGREMPDLLRAWDILRNTARDDEELYERYMELVFTLTQAMNLIGERSRLILVSNMATYYLVSPTLSAIPEASTRLINIGNVLRRNLYHAEYTIEQWNHSLAVAHADGRRLGTRPFEGDPRLMGMNMLPTADSQFIRNARALFEADRERISYSLRSAMEVGMDDEFEELTMRIERFEETLYALLRQFGRMGGMGAGAAGIATVAEVLDTVSQLNTHLCQLWAEAFVRLEAQIQHNGARAQRQLARYLMVVFTSLGLAITLIIFILIDLRRSVKTLKTLFRGLNENDLTMSLKINSEDEFGELMTAFNGFLDILRNTFGSFKQSTQLVADSVFDISSSSKEITTTANQQSASVSEIVSTMEGSKNLSEQIALKTTEVANLAVETQELSRNGMELNQENLHMMETILKQNQKTISEMRNLSDMIIRISEAIRIIDSIADQTKLIAFNASLEASSSGEAGARFSVVASEIRRFADNVAESTLEIKQRIEEVQEASQTLIAEANSGSKQIELGYERMREEKEEFEQIVGNSKNVATRSQQISNLSKQQELASSQIFIALKEISAGVKQFVIATSSTSQIADSLNNMSEELKGQVEKYRTET